MGNKSEGLKKKYEVSKISNRGKDVDCIVLEFDDPIARVGIGCWAREMDAKGYHACAEQVYKKLIHYTKKDKGE